MELTARELATAIVFVTIITVAVLLSRDRSQLVDAAVGVLKALLAWKLWLVILAYLVYAAGVVVIAHFLGLWSTELLKDTLIVVFFVGLPIRLFVMKRG